MSSFSALTRALVRRADSVLVLSNEEAMQFRRQVGVKACSVVVNPFVPRWKNNPGHATRKDAQPFRLLFVGRLMREKGVLDCVRALAILAKGRTVTLDIAGTGPAEAELHALRSEVGLEGRVRLHGYVEAEDLGQLYESADAFVFPTYWKEGFPQFSPKPCIPGCPSSLRRAEARPITCARESTLSSCLRRIQPFWQLLLTGWSMTMSFETECRMRTGPSWTSSTPAELARSS